MIDMNVLIVGKNSFVGQGVGAWFAQKVPAPRVDYLSVRDGRWKEMDLSCYDAVIFAAALVHRPDVTDWALYEQLNVHLPYSFALHAKACGVGQFVFFSSVSVYRAERTLPVGTVIDGNTPPEPDSLYGKSKLQAEQALQTLADGAFCVSIIRPTYVYGQGCRGRHIEVQKKLSRMLPILPDAFSDVKMGMVYIDNLAELCWLTVHSGCSGIYHAQDRVPMSTAQILHTLAPEKKQVRCQWLLRPFVGLSAAKRLFGGTAYKEELAKCPLGEYQLISMADALRRSALQKKGETI